MMGAQSRQDAGSNGFPLNAAHFADPAKRAALFNGLLREIAGTAPAQRERSIRDALETAFLAGVTLVRADPGFDPGGAASDIPRIIDLTDLPLDAQDGFILMSDVVGLGRPGSHPHREPEPLVLRPFYTRDAKRSWWAELPEPAAHARWTPWVIVTLERFGLVTEMPNNPGRSTLTQRAITLMQTGKTSRDIPTIAAWERNAKARGHSTSDLTQPAHG
jgi:hypothetical protein